MSLKLALNALWLLFARLGSQALALGLTALIAHALGASGLGRYAFIATCVLLGNAFSTFGTDTLIIRAGQSASALLGTALWLQLGLAVLWCMGVALVPTFPLELHLSLGVASLALLPLALYTVCTAALRAHERMDLFLWVNLGAALMQIVAGAIALRLQPTLLAVCVALTSAQVGAMLLAAGVCRWCLPHFSVTGRVAWRDVRQMVAVAWRLAALMVVALLAQRLSLLVVAALLSDMATGWFSAGARLVEGLKAGHLAVFGALLPALSRAPRAANLRTTTLGLFALALGLALGVSVFADPLIQWLYGPQFASAVGALQIQIWTLIPYTVTAALSLGLIARGADHAVLVGHAVSLPLMLLAYLGLIARFGWAGAAWAMPVSESLQAAMFVGVYLNASPAARLN